MNTKGVSRFSVSAPPELLDEFDEVINEYGYPRSKAIGLAMRDFLVEYALKEQPDKNAVGALTLIANHEKEGSDKELTRVQHHHHDIIISTTYVHRDDQNCLIVVLVRGQVGSIQNLSRDLMGVRGIKQLKVALLAT